ncbi:MAG: hypothetical protein Ct9H300mP11_29130 [Chloroflexota bacterium]|nr:MAG: hypothetical protein Ct9H300mP11_29130 [Chloroflexota bacterium]
MKELYIKEEGLNPTGTFKARGISAAVSKAMELKVDGFTMPRLATRPERPRRTGLDLDGD